MIANWDGTDKDNQLPVPINVLREITQALILTVRRDSAVRIAGRSGDRIPMEARFSALVQTGPGAHPASYIIGTTDLHLAQRLKKE